jgi:flagellar motility protein MotE (MotC chaperone)
MSEELSNQEADSLSALKARMNQKQRAEMAEIIRNEMIRRGMAVDEPEGGNSVNKKTSVKAAGISGGLSGDQVKELYQDVGKAVQELRVKKLEQQLAQVRGPVRKSVAIKAPRLSLPGGGVRYALMYGVIGLGFLKVVAISGVFESTEATAKTANPMLNVSGSQQIATIPGQLWTPAEKELLTQLDQRRVELERRKESLDRREQELKNQSSVLTERLAELRGLTAKLQELRKERDNKQEGRLAQLANVYGAMDPNEAATLISRLEDQIALELLERMPEKRIGQILAFMERGRAVELTRLLTEKKIVN